MSDDHNGYETIVDEDNAQLKFNLDPDRDLKSNIMTLISFAYAQFKQEQRPAVRNKHEGFGVSTEYFMNMASCFKSTKANMDTYAKILPASESSAINTCGALYNDAMNTSVMAINLAVQCQRILDDLYYSNTDTPIEEYLAGFQDAQSIEDESMSDDPEQEIEIEIGEEV